MSARINKRLTLAISLILSGIGADAFSAELSPLTQKELASQLGWINSAENICGGYYLEQPFLYPEESNKKSTVQLTGSQALFSQLGTTVLEGQVSLIRFGQQITANKAYLYRDPTTSKLTSMDLFGNVHLREPNTLVIANSGHYDFTSKNKTLQDIIYRTSMLNPKQPNINYVSEDDMQQERKITNLTAWGKANEFAQNEPKVYDLYRTTFSTCPPTNPAWHVRASHIVLNKNSGRGYATNARIYVKDVPVFYIPYFNFSIDHQRKSGFLWPTAGNSAVTPSYDGYGPYLLAPFYWNMAPNYDMTITPGLLSKRGVRVTDKFRYLSVFGGGDLNFAILPNDSLFHDYQEFAKSQYSNSGSSATQADLSRLLSAGTTRTNLSWVDDSQFNSHWSSHVDFNYAGDDYVLRNLGGTNSEITQNQLLQEGDLYYKGENWNFISRLQTYQTLHPIDEPQVLNQYRRFPQLLLSAHYPDQAFGLEYFVETEATHFDLRNTPGTLANQPVGNRFHLQPGISLPLFWPYFFINPRVQVSMTGYNLNQTFETNAPASAKRTIPIFDMVMGFALNRDTNLFNHSFQQTLEPQIYYTYIPYRNQASIPIFDTTVNTLTYDQIFNYNRFSNIDRIGDANQIGAGVSSRFLDSETGLEKIRIGVGEIIFFSNRRVTFCNTTACVDNPFNPANHWRLSPISGLLSYSVNPAWTFGANALANPISKQLSNATLSLAYKTDEKHLLNFGYGYLFNGDPLSGGISGSSANNLKLSDFSFVWPVGEQVSVVGRWSQNWNQQHLQNLTYGLQYDTCCWGVRIVGDRAFTHLNTIQNSSPQYLNNFYIQFALKGLGSIGSGNPGGILKTINGYTSQFGQEF